MWPQSTGYNTSAPTQSYGPQLSPLSWDGKKSDAYISSDGQVRQKGDPKFPVGKLPDGRTLYADGSSGWTQWSPTYATSAPKSTQSKDVYGSNLTDFGGSNGGGGGGWGGGGYSYDYGGGSPESSAPQNKIPTAEDIIGAQMDKIKEQVSYLKDYMGKNPFTFDEALARTMATDKYKPYYTEVLNDFVNPLKEKISRSETDQVKVLGELTRQTEYGKVKMGRELQDAIDMAQEGLAGSGLLDSGVGRRYTQSSKVIPGQDNIKDFTASMQYKTDANKTQMERDRADMNTLIEQKNRDIMGTGRQLDTSVTQDVESQRGTSQKQYGSKLLESLTSRFGSSSVNVNDYTGF